MDSSTRVLLIEHLDATGAAVADARSRAAALRAAGHTVDVVVLDASAQDDLLYPHHVRRSVAGVEVIRDDAAGRETLRKRIAAKRPASVIWASATPGGGDAARVLPRDLEAHWWPSGYAPANAAHGPLPALDASLAPCAGDACVHEGGGRSRLSLWDGPFLLAPAPLGREGGEAVIDAFAEAASERDEVDLVVLDHADATLEARAARAGVGLRVHFVGPAPREAEHAWLATATAAVLCGETSVTGGLLLRMLAAGCPILPAGRAAAPLAAWLRAHGAAWAEGLPLEAGIARALDRDAGVMRARERGREVAAEHDLATLTARFVAALGRGEARAA